MDTLAAVSSFGKKPVNLRWLLAHMIDDLLDVGRVISGKVLLSRRAIDIAMIAQRGTRDVRIARL